MGRSTKLDRGWRPCALAPWHPLQSDQLPLVCIHLAPPTTVVRALLIVTAKHSRTPIPMPRPSLTTQVTSSGCLVYIITLVPCALPSHCLSEINKRCYHRINVDLPHCTVNIIKSLVTLPYPLLSTTILRLGLILVPHLQGDLPWMPKSPAFTCSQDRFLRWVPCGSGCWSFSTLVSLCDHTLSRVIKIWLLSVSATHYQLLEGRIHVFFSYSNTFIVTSI